MNWTCYRTFSKKKDLDKHSRLVPISLKLIFLKVTDFWSVKNRCYKIWTYYISMVRKINEEQLLQKKCVLKVSNFKVILKHICWKSYINIFVYIFEVHECKCCLFESLWAILYIEKLWNRYCIELCCITMLIRLRAIVIISAEKPNLQYIWVYSPYWHFCKLWNMSLFS